MRMHFAILSFFLDMLGQRTKARANDSLAFPKECKVVFLKDVFKPSLSERALVALTRRLEKTQEKR
jgi:hypothetical protein